ncbi:hypothetical protein, partial [Thermococcus sp.]
KKPGEREVLSKLVDLVQWGYLNHEPFKDALLKAKIHRNTRTEEIIELCKELIDRFGIATRRKILQEEAKKRGLKGTKPHIVAGLLFMPGKGETS